MAILPRDGEKPFPTERIKFRIPVTIEQIEHTNRWLERKIDAKLASAFRLHERSVRPAVTRMRGTVRVLG